MKMARNPDDWLCHVTWRMRPVQDAQLAQLMANLLGCKMTHQLAPVCVVVAYSVKTGEVVLCVGADQLATEEELKRQLVEGW